MAKSITKRAARKSERPAKPRPDFPLFPHATKRWAKKIRGKLCYFGPWDDPDAALQKYLDQAEYLHAGRLPPTVRDGTTIADLANHFLTAKTLLLESAELSKATFRDYHRTCANIVDHFGKQRLVDDVRPDEFDRLRAKLAKTLGVVALGNEVNRVRIVFRYAFEGGLVDRTVRFGPHFKRPRRQLVRKARQAAGPRMFDADELRKIIKAAPSPLKAMILLGINCGFGNNDVAALPIAAVDLDKGWIEYPRPKTAVPRRCPLWPETIKAIRTAKANRPAPKNEDDDRLLFITKFGERFVRDGSSGPIDGIAQNFRKLLIALGIRRERVAFYALRHTFETVGGGARDQVAVDAIMGHADQSMAAVYREGIGDDRLIAVVNHVRTWLYGRAK